MTKHRECENCSWSLLTIPNMCYMIRFDITVVRNATMSVNISLSIFVKDKCLTCCTLKTLGRSKLFARH